MGEPLPTDESEDDRRVILKVTVEVSEDSSDAILVREGDHPRDLAANFCALHGLQDSLIAPLTGHIVENLERARPSGKSPVSQARREDAEQHRAVTPGRRAASGGRPVRSREGTPRGSHRDLGSAGSRPGTPTRSKPVPARGDTPRTPRVNSAPRTTPRTSVTDHADRLYRDAAERRGKLDKLRKQVEDDIVEQQRRTTLQSSSSSTPRTSRAALRTPDQAVLGDRLHHDAMQRQLKMKHLQEQHAARKLLQEQREATFRPDIGHSQRSCRGVSRSKGDPEGAKTKKKLEHLRQMKEKDTLGECTFRPEIDHRSEELMTQRMGRQIGGPPCHHLYDDAHLRLEKQLANERSLPSGVTFQPDIGSSRFRPANDDTREDFVNRLTYSKSYSERPLPSDQENSNSLQSRPQPDFHPKTGRPPLFERNKDGLPIGERLHEAAKEKAVQSQALQEENDKLRSQLSKPSMIESSRAMIEETKRRKFRDLYEHLTRLDPDQKLRIGTIDVDDLDEEMEEFLRPMVAYLRETKAIVELDSFCAALEYQLQQTVTPTAHLFVQRNSARTSELYRQQREGEDFTPRIDPKSNRIADRHRPRGGEPLHEQLLREKEAWTARKFEQRATEEERALRECTFQPNASYSPGAPRPRSAGLAGLAAPRVVSPGAGLDGADLQGPFFARELPSTSRSVGALALGGIGHSEGATVFG